MTIEESLLRLRVRKVIRRILPWCINLAAIDRTIDALETGATGE